MRNEEEIREKLKEVREKVRMCYDLRLDLEGIWWKAIAEALEWVLGEREEI